MTSATDEIRAELTRLGVDWANRDSFNDYKTVWHHGHTSYLFIESIFDSDMAILKVRKPTPEQAIAATLGAGTCHDKNGFDVTLGFECTVCGAMTDGYMLSPADTGHYKQFNFCPMCGRRIEQ